MGRKRKTRWRRLSIGEVSGNEEEEVHEMNGDGDVSLNRQRSASQLSLNNSSHGDTPTMSSKTSLVEVYPKDVVSKTPNQYEENGSTESSYHNQPHHQYHNGHHHSHYNHYSKERGGDRGDGPPHSNGGGSYHNGGGSHQHHNSSGSYYQNYYQRNSYNNYRNTHYDSRGNGTGYQGGGGSEYNNYSETSRYGGRFRKPRSYSSNYYYNNGTSGAQQADSTIKPSYNQDEYTKITTPRQDVLFKKGYLSQRKPAAQSSVESTSSATTPSASTNGTPDTHSTNGVNSDYSEGYENGETDCGIPPYDDTVYYGPPAEAVFTDPNTGQVYYGQCSSNGEYFDAYPVSSVVVAGYPTAPVYYQLSYPPIDWNGVPNPYNVPVVAAAALPVVDDQLISSGVQGAERQTNSWSGKNGEIVEDGHIKKNGETTRTSPPPLAGSLPGKRAGSDGPPVTKKGTVLGHGGVDPSSLGSSSSSTTSSSSSPSSLASTPMSPSSGGGVTLQHHSLPTSMSNLSLSSVSPSHLHHHPHVLPHFLATVPPPTHPQHQQHGPQPPHSFLYQHPAAGFMYGPPIYNGVVVPIAPTASAAAASSSLEISSNNRKKRKKRRRKKDGQLTDESSDDESGSTISINEEELLSKNIKESITYNTNTTQDFTNKSPNSDEKLDQTEAEAKIKDLTSEEDSRPEIDGNLVHEKTDFKIKTLKLNETENEEVTSDKDESSEKTEEAGESQNIENATEESSTEVKEVCITEVEVVNPSAKGEASTSVVVTTIKNLPLKKPIDLTVLCPLNSLASNDLQLLSLQRSPDGLEPSSPDSLNTNQSVAGSEIASVSESDLMNRTTSLDEVEEDLPVECEEIENMSSESSVQSNSNVVKILEDKKLFEKDESGSSNNVPEVNPETVISSTRDNLWGIYSPSFTPSESTEPSPSPETIFERQIEPAIQTEELNSEAEVPEEPILDCEFRSLTDTALESTNVECESGLSSPTQESLVQSVLSPVDQEVDLPEIVEPVVVEKLLPLVEVAQNPTCQLEPEPPDIPEAPFIHEVSMSRPEEVLTLTSENVDSATQALQRPTSITLAVSEWLKAQGEDALTPVSQLQAQLEAAGADADGDGDEDDDDDESLKADELGNLNPNQKNAHGNPWVVPSNKSGAREGRLTGLKVLRSKDGVSVDGICSRVAGVTITSSSSTSPLTMKPEVDDMSLKEEKLTDEDSGLEHSSPEASPAKAKVSSPKKYRDRRVNSTKTPITPLYEHTNDSNSSDIICDPQKFTKYYQFGVVFEKDQGIELDESPFQEDNEMVNSITCKKVMLKCDFDDGNDEVGTFVPITSKSETYSKNLSNKTTPTLTRNSADAFVQKDKTAKAKSFTHLYVNPFSLAAEMDTCTDLPSNLTSEDYAWDDAIPLPPYESPSPVEYPIPPVFSHLTPKAKLIQNQDQLGSLFPIPRAICCVIQ